MESYDEENYLAYRSFNPIKLPKSASWSPMVKSCISGIYAYVLFCRAVSNLICMGHYLHRLELFQKNWLMAMLCCLLILTYTFPPHVHYHKLICTYCFLLSLTLSSVPLFASVFSPTPSLPPVFPLLYCIPPWGVCICRGASWSQGIFLLALTFAPTVPRFSLLCFVLSGFTELACDTAGCPLIRYSSWLFEDVSVSVAGCVCRGAGNVGVCRNLYSWLNATHLI